MTYTKEINGRQVFSSCKTIQTLDGIWISNPSEEQIAAAGWTVYIPPVVEPSATVEPELDEVIMAIKQLLSTEATNLSDEDALGVAALYPTWVSKIGETVSIGDRFWYDGRLWKVIQAHTVQEDWTPNEAKSLYTEITIEEWPIWVQPIGAEDAYNIGDKITYNGEHYVSTINSNVYSPEAYPAGWQKQ